MRRFWLGALFALAVGTVAFRADAVEAKRVALVIGNGAYQNAPKLPNPANDARDVAALLRALDFDVLEAIDLDRAAFVKSVGTFLDKAAGAPAALLYYSGHGIQYNENNYLIATDAKLENLYSLKSEAFSLQEIIADLEAVSDVNLVFLDACRDNPLAESLSRSIKSRSGASPIGRGLARVAPNGGNTFVAFAAAPGNVALDGVGRNSPFTRAFLKNVEVSNDDVMSLFKGVIRDVVAATDGKQRPQMVSGMTIDFYFSGNPTVTVNATLSEAQAAYQAAAQIGSKAAYQSIIDSFPGTVQGKLAAAAIEPLIAKEAADKAKADETAEKAKKAAEAAAAKVNAPAAPVTQLAALPPDEVEKALLLTKEQKREIQLALERFGYKTGRPDSNLGSATRKAIGAFQAASGVPETGYASANLLAALGIPIGAPAEIVMSEEARRYTLASLGADPEPRLAKAIGTLGQYELRYGYFRDRLYVAVLTWGATWDNAKQLAESAGGHLLTITDKAENDFAYNLFATDDRFVEVNDDGTDKNGPWIGLYQPKGSKEPKGGWRWVTNEPLKYTNWTQGQPNNWQGVAHVGVFYSYGAREPKQEQRVIVWDDAKGEDGRSGFIMEIEGPAPIDKVEPKLDLPPAADVANLSPDLIEKGLKLSPMQMREVRLGLERLGYNTGGESGAFGQKTRDAIALYQSAVGVQSTGYVSLNLLASLGIPFSTADERPTGDARKYTIASLRPDADPRLVKAIVALSDTELRFGYFEQRLYVAVLKELTWQAAKELSERAGGHLVTITSKTEQDFVTDLFLADERFTFMEPDTFLNGPWIGLFQADGAREPKGGWQWVTGEPVKFTNWSPWAPDNNTAGENFGRFWGATKKGPEKRAVWWDDGLGKAEFRGFIMEVQ